MLKYNIGLNMFKNNTVLYVAVKLRCDLIQFP
jgi:hypothetical protein